MVTLHAKYWVPCKRPAGPRYRENESTGRHIQCVKNVNTMLAKSSKHVKLWPKLVSNRCKPVISFMLAGNRDEQLLPRVVNSSPKPFARSLRQLCRTANRVYNKFSICGTVCMRPVIVCTAVLLCMIEAL